jgi:hypothetical protein
MTRWVRLRGWTLFYLLIFLFGPGAFSHLSWAADLHSRLAAGEIISYTENLPGSNAKRGEVQGVIDAPPKMVWQVISDVNHFEEFMDRILHSQVVTPEKVQEIQQKRPTKAREVREILGPTPPDPAPFRVPGQRYVEYNYGHVDLPWPLGDRWYILNMVRDESQTAQYRYSASWSLVIGNLRENRGEVRLEPFGKQKTLLIYRLTTDPGGIIPPFFVKRGTYIALPRIVADVRKRVAQVAPN